MTNCPKCGGGRIAGPSYRRGLFGEEMLRYECCQCGFVKMQPTLDQQRKEQRDIDLLRTTRERQ